MFTVRFLKASDLLIFPEPIEVIDKIFPNPAFFILRLGVF